MFLTAGATFSANEPDGYINAHLTEGPVFINATYWDAGDVDSFYDQTQEITAVIPVTAGPHTYSLNLAESSTTAFSFYMEPQIDAIFVPATM